MQSFILKSDKDKSPLCRRSTKVWFSKSKKSYTVIAFHPNYYPCFRIPIQRRRSVLKFAKKVQFNVWFDISWKYRILQNIFGIQFGLSTIGIWSWHFCLKAKLNDFWNFSNGEALKGSEKWRKNNQKCVDFSLWGTCEKIHTNALFLHF